MARALQFPFAVPLKCTQRSATVEPCATQGVCTAPWSSDPSLSLLVVHTLHAPCASKGSCHRRPSIAPEMRRHHMTSAHHNERWAGKRTRNQSLLQNVHCEIYTPRVLFWDHNGVGGHASGQRKLGRYGSTEHANGVQTRVQIVRPGVRGVQRRQKRNVGRRRGARMCECACVSVHVHYCVGVTGVWMCACACV
jgi:hypothetical protein